MNLPHFFSITVESEESKLIQRREHDKLRKRLWREKNPEEIIRDAYEAGYDGDYEEALEILDKGIYLFSSRFDETEQKTELLNMKAIALQELGKNDEALKAIEKAIKIDKKDPTLWLTKMDILHELGKYEEAVIAINTSLKLCPKKLKPELYAPKAHALGHLKKYKEAIEFFNKSLEYDPENTDAWVGKSEELFDQGKNKESLKACEEGLKVDPDDEELLFQKGVILLELKKAKEALPIFEKSILFDSTDDSAWYNKACALSILNKKEESLDALTVATALNSDCILEMKKEKQFENIKNTKQFIRLSNQEV